MSDLEWTILFVGRLLVGGGFLHAAVRNIPSFDRLTTTLASRGVPMARGALVAATAVQAIASILLILGLWMPWATVALIGFTILVTPVFHNFWDYDGDERVAKRISFRINVIVTGALCGMLVATLR